MSTAGQDVKPHSGLVGHAAFERFCCAMWQSLDGVRLGFLPNWSELPIGGRERFRQSVRYAFEHGISALPPERKNTRANLLWFADLQPKEG